ncbi:MAG: hypothetical protein P1V20_10315 [Verrucomicrobiales bacterium]|nr:hypothetical protein [Verrucomicrobiales bacterium]
MSEQTEAIVRRHAHDVRNNLYALDLQAMLLEESYPDPTSKPHQLALKIRRELGLVESQLRSLVACFAEADIEPVGVQDFFYMWKSRFNKFVPNAEVGWSCEAESESINIDAAMVADLLATLLAAAVSADCEPVASVKIQADEACFEIRLAEGRKMDFPVEWEKIFERNGGRFESTDESDRFTLKGLFPLT